MGEDVGFINKMDFNKLDSKKYYVGNSGKLFFKINYEEINHEGKYDIHSGYYIVASDFEGRKPSIKIDQKYPSDIPQDAKIIEHNEGNIVIAPYTGNFEDGSAVSCGMGIALTTEKNNGTWFCPYKADKEIIDPNATNIEIIPDPTKFSFGNEQEIDEGMNQ